MPKLTSAMRFSKNILLLGACLTVFLACRKDSVKGDHLTPLVLKTIRFQLYTTEDFKMESGHVIFKLFIEAPMRHIIWDSLLPPIRVNQVPDSLHKICVERKIMIKPEDTIRAGFRYSIEDVGSSSYLDTLSPGTRFKLIEFNFR
jgi:hypothetical protein